MPFREMYSELDSVIRNTLDAFEYGAIHFDELMSRPIAHILYGIPSQPALAVASPSLFFVPEKNRLLSHKTKRKNYAEYAFDENWNLLRTRYYYEYGNRLDCTILYFRIGDTLYCRFFSQDKNEFYSRDVYCVKYQNAIPVYCAHAMGERYLLIEYQNTINSDSIDSVIYCYRPYSDEEMLSVSRCSYPPLTSLFHIQE